MVDKVWENWILTHVGAFFVRHKLNKPILTSISTLIISDWSKSVGLKSSILLLFLNPNLTSFYLYLLNWFKFNFQIWKESLSSRYCEKWAQRLCYRPCNMKNDHSCYASPFNAKDKIYFLHSFIFWVLKVARFAAKIDLRHISLCLVELQFN